MNRQLLIDALVRLNGLARSSSEPMLRIELTAEIDKALTEAAKYPDAAQLGKLAHDYELVRTFVVDERSRRDKAFSRMKVPFRERKIGECDNAGQALGRMARWLGLQVPEAIRQMEDEPHQAQLL